MSKLMILSHFLGSYFWVYFFHWPLKCNANKQEAKLSFLIIFCLWLYGCSCCDHLSFGQSATKNVKNKIKNSFFDIFCCKTDNLFSILFVFGKKHTLFFIKFWYQYHIKLLTWSFRQFRNPFVHVFFWMNQNNSF